MAQAQLPLNNQGGCWGADILRHRMAQSLLRRREISELISGLVDRSMVSFDERTGRYRMNESLRSFAQELEEEDGHDSHPTHFRFFRYLYHLADRAHAQMQGSEELEAIEMLGCEIDNFRAAFDWALQEPGTEASALGLARRLGPYWEVDHVAEGKRWLQAALEGKASADPLDVAWGQYYYCRLRFRMQDMEGLKDLMDECGRNMKATGDQRGYAMVLSVAAWPYYIARDMENFKRAANLALETSRELGLRAHTAGPLVALGELARLEGDPALAKTYYLEAIEALAAEGKAPRIPKQNLAASCLELAEWDDAEGIYRECIEEARRFSDSATVAYALEGIGHVRAAQGDFERAGLLIGFGDELLGQLGETRDPADESLRSRHVSDAKAKGGDLFEEALRRGALLSLDEAISLLGPWPSAIP